MSTSKVAFPTLLSIALSLSLMFQSPFDRNNTFLSLVFPSPADRNNTSTLIVDVSSGKPISKYFFGVFFEEINHAEAGGLWAELVNNRGKLKAISTIDLSLTKNFVLGLGFEAGGTTLHSSISPWTIIGNSSNINVQIEPTSLFSSNKMAVKLYIHCPSHAKCPNGVGLSNPRFWDMVSFLPSGPG